MMISSSQEISTLDHLKISLLLFLLLGFFYAGSRQLGNDPPQDRPDNYEAYLDSIKKYSRTDPELSRQFILQGISWASENQKVEAKIRFTIEWLELLSSRNHDSAEVLVSHIANLIESRWSRSVIWTALLKSG